MQPTASQSNVDSNAESNVENLSHQLLVTVNRWLKSQPEVMVREAEAGTDLRSLGLDSLATTSLALEIEQAHRVRLSPDILFECGSVLAVARYLAAEQASLRKPGAKQNGHANLIEPRRESLNDRLALKNQRQRDWRAQGNYFLESRIERRAGNWVDVEGQQLLMLASYSYLGFVGEESVVQAATTAAERFGTGSHGARLLAGTTSEHLLLERELAHFMRSERAIVYGSGYMANLATIDALVGDGDLVVGDELNHASIADGCQFSSASFKKFRHNDVADLDRILAQSGASQKLVVIDAVYSMEGDLAPLPVIVKVCRQHGAALMVDEAHSLGVIGKTGRGIQEHFDLPADAIDIKMGTLSKAISSCGGFIAAGAETIDYLRHHARGYIFSGALPAPQVAAARECLRLLCAEPERVVQLRQNIAQFVKGLRRLGFNVPATESAIVPIVFEDEATTLQMVRRCREGGLFVVPVFYPAVPMNAPRIRATIMATHTASEIDHALSIFGEARALLRNDEKLAESACSLV